MPFIALLFTACETTPPKAEPVLEELELFPAAGLSVYPTITEGAVVARAAHTTSVGTGIYGGDITFTITAPNGETSTETVPSDALGFAKYEFDLPEGQYTVSASSDGFSAEGIAYNIPDVSPFPSSMGSLSIDPEGYTDKAVRGASGSYLLSSNSLIFYPDQIGTEGYVAAQFPALLMGVWATHIDDDGILDLVCWSASEAYLLRGHHDGGLHYIQGYRIPDNAIVSMIAEDLNLDGHTDIVIAGSTAETSVVTMLKGSGSWTFNEQTPLELVYPIDAMSAADESLDGRFEVNVVSSLDGIIRRHSLNDDIWLGGSPSVIAPEAFTALPGSVLPPPEDIDADGRKDLLIVGGQGASSQSLVFFIINNTVTKYDQTYGSYYADFFDVDSNKSVDILAMEEDTLHLVSYQPDTSTYTAKSVGNLGAAGPITTYDGTDDGLAEVTVFNPNPTRHNGYSTDLLSWSLYTPTWRRSETNFSAKHVVWDVGLDTSKELVGFISQADSTRLRAMPLTVSIDNILDIDGTAYSSVDLGNVTALDLVGCGEYVYALTNDAITTQIQQFGIIDLLDGTDPTFELLGSVDVDGTDMSCHATGGEPRVLVFGGSDTYTYFNESLQSNTGSVGDFIGMTLHINADGDLAATGCNQVGCEIRAADLNNNGIDEVIRANPDAGIDIFMDGDTANGFTLPLQRTLESLTDNGPILSTTSIRDIDLDGTPELVIRDEASGLYWVYRGTDGGLTPPYSINLFTESVLMPYFADIDLDGIPEAFTDDTEGKFAATPLSSTLQ